jgi:hypothetical protein
MKRIITLFLVFYSLLSFAQCPLNLLADDLSKTNKEFKEFVNQSSGFRAWQILEKEAPTLRTDISELNLVSKNLDAIEKAGGYTKWKGLQSGARQSWNGATNIFKATADEIAEGTAKIKNHRLAQNAGTNGNYGYLEGKIGAINKNGELIRSGEPDKINEIFEALKVNPQQEIGGTNSWLRNTDSEYKMLNRLANELNGIKGKTYKEITGELKIASERPYCPSCQGVIQQFNEMYPNVKLILIDGIK